MDGMSCKLLLWIDDINEGLCLIGCVSIERRSMHISPQLRERGRRRKHNRRTLLEKEGGRSSVPFVLILLSLLLVGSVGNSFMCAYPYIYIEGG